MVAAQIAERLIDENELWHAGPCDNINSMIPDCGKRRRPAPWLPALSLLLAVLPAALLPGTAHAAATAYLPLNLAPEMESRIERC